MEEALEIKSPWTMIPTGYINRFIAEIREALPPDHPLQEHEIFPGIKWARRPIFIVNDDTTGEPHPHGLRADETLAETKFKVPAMQVLRDDSEVAAMIERDHLAEVARYRADAASE